MEFRTPTMERGGRESRYEARRILFCFETSYIIYSIVHCTAFLRSREEDGSREISGRQVGKDDEHEKAGN